MKEFAEHLKQEHLDAIQRKAKPVFHKIGIPFKGKNEQYYSYCNTHNIHNFGRQRLVINYRQADLSDNPVFYISNRLVWQAAGITRIRRHTCNCSTGASVAGRWRSTTRKERMKAWTSTNCGTSTLSKDTSRWLPLFIVYCEPANMIPTFANDFNANSRYRLKITQQHGVAFHKHNLCGV